MSVSQIEYITNPSNYIGANPRDKFGQHTKGVYAPIRIDWNKAYKVQVSNDGTNNIFTSQDANGNTLYSGNLVNGFALETDEISVSVSGGNVYVTTKGSALYIIENTSTASAILTTTQFSRVKATCKGSGTFQLISQDNSMIEADFEGGSDAYIDQNQTAAFTAKDTSLMFLTLGANYEGTTQVQIASKDNAIINLTMKDTAALHGGKNERGIIECLNNGTINITMQDNTEIVATGSNQSYFALNANQSANINLKMKDNALIKCGNTNAYALNIYGTSASFDLDMKGSSQIQISSAYSSARAVWVRGGDFNITMSENSKITCNGYGSWTCFAVGGQANTNIQIILKDNAILTNGKSSGKSGNLADVAAGATGSNPCYVTIYDARDVKSANTLSYSINQNTSRVSYKGSGAANGVKV